MEKLLTHKLNETVLKKQYAGYLIDKIIQYSRVGSILVIFILSYFLYRDLHNPAIDNIFVIFRIIPMLLALLLALTCFSPLKKHKTLIRNLYIIILFSFMVMASAIFVCMNSYQERFIIGLMLTIFCIHVGSLYGMRLLIPVYIIPLAGTILYLAVASKIHDRQLLDFANPIALAILSTAIAEIRYDRNYRDFVSRKLVEYQNRELLTEMNLAKSIQNSLTPKVCPLVPNFSLHVIYEPMILLGGDFYDYIYFKDEKKLGIFICDVSGHGASAALIASMVKALINSAGPYKQSPASLLKYINNQLIDQTDGNFITAFYGIYDAVNMTLQYARGGHCFPLLIRNDEIHELKSKGPWLAVRNEIEIEEKKIQLRSNDKLFLYTDGLTEAVNTRGEMFENHLEKVLLRHAVNPSVKNFIDSVHKELVKFCGSTEFGDDVCVIGIRIH